MLGGLRGLTRFATACALLAAPALALASGGDKPAGARGAATTGLGSADPVQVAAAIDALGERGDARAVETLAAFVRAGQPDALTDRALLALGKRGAHGTLSVLTEFTRHRRASARTAAFTAIARVPGAPADELLAQGLRDGDAGVRGLCARSLAERGARSQLDMLFRAFARGVPEASYAIGRLGDAANLPRFEQQLGRLPIQVMLAGYEQFLLRADLGEALKLELVAHLGEVASLGVKRFLEGLIATQDWSKQTRLLHALTETARRIDTRTRTKPKPEADTSTPRAPEGKP